MTHLELTDINGTRWRGDVNAEPLTAEDREQIAELLADLKTLTSLSLVVDGSKHYFNPAHIVHVSVHEDDGEFPR